MSDDREVEYDNDPNIICLNDAVILQSNRTGIVRYISDKSRDRIAVGIELTEPNISNIDVSKLFKCKANHGLLVPLTQITRKIMPEELLNQLEILTNKVNKYYKQIQQLRTKLVENENQYARWCTNQFLNKRGNNNHINHSSNNNNNNHHHRHHSTRNRNYISHRTTNNKNHGHNHNGFKCKTDQSGSGNDSTTAKPYIVNDLIDDIKKNNKYENEASHRSYHSNTYKTNHSNTNNQFQVDYISNDIDNSINLNIGINSISNYQYKQKEKEKKKEIDNISHSNSKFRKKRKSNHGHEKSRSRNNTTNNSNSRHKKHRKNTKKESKHKKRSSTNNYLLISADGGSNHNIDNVDKINKENNANGINQTDLIFN